MSAPSSLSEATSARLQRAWLQACTLDVAVVKPGNVALGRPGHRMQAEDFLASAHAAAPAIIAPGQRVGERVEAAVNATWDAVGCNTNLGIVLLLAPLLRAAERVLEKAPTLTLPALRASLAEVLHGFDALDAQAVFRAIARATPGGLGDAPEADVREPAKVDLRTAMGLAAHRDRIAHAYVHDHDEIFETFEVFQTAWRPVAFDPDGRPGAATAYAMQASFLHLLARAPDTHIVRKHGPAAALTVQAQAQDWVRRGGPPQEGQEGAALADWLAWDEALKRQGLNPGTCADLAVATAGVASLLS